MKHRIKILSLLLATIFAFSIMVMPVYADYSYPMKVTITYKTESGSTLGTYTCTVNAAASERNALAITSPSYEGYALKDSSDAVVTGSMISWYFPASNYVRNGTGSYTVYYVPAYSVTIYYLYKASNRPAAGSTTLSGKTGSSYYASSPSVTGYSPDKTSVSGTYGSSNSYEYVYYYENTYTIAFHANGGSGAPSSMTKNHFTDLTLPSTVPTRAGYDFVGWNTSPYAVVATHQPGDKFTYNGNCTLYAIWSRKTYNISYDANGGVGAPSTQEKMHGVDLTLSNIRPTRSGYTFKGWGLSSGATYARFQPGDTYTSNASRDLYAIWEENAPTLYTVSYNANGGTGAPSSQTKTHDVTLTLSSTRPTRSGYTFKGWSISSSATSVNYSPGGSYTNNASITLYAVWACAHPASTRTYITGCDWKAVCNTCGAITGSGTSHGPYSYGSWAYYSSTEHFRIKSCNYGDYSIYEYESHSTAITYDQYSAIKHKKYSYCTTCSTTVGTVSYETHTFTTITSGGKITKTCALCGYTESEDQTYTVSYNANGGSGAPSSQTKAHGIALTLSSVQPTRTGYIFKGWAINSSATSASYSSGDTYSANEDITLYAVWECSHTSYNTRYVTGCDWERYCTTCGVVLATGTTHGPYSYSGWVYSNTSSHSRVTACDYGDYSTIEFAVHNTIIVFESVSESQHKYYSYCAECDHAVGSETLEPHALESSIVGGIIKYECSLCGYYDSVPLTYVVSYDANGGDDIPSDQEKTHDVSLTLSSMIPTRVGYDFKGWGTTPGTTTATYQPGDSYMANMDIILYAVWERSVYTVTYNANGGSGAPASQTKNYGGTITIPSTVPTRTNHVFKGWATTSSATDVEYNPGDSYTADASVTLYAVWIERNYDFSISDLTITPNEVRQYEKVTVRFRTDSWDKNLPYDNIPVEVLLNGTVIFTRNLNFTAYGIQNIVFDLNVGELIGEQTLEARINWADHMSETRTGNNAVSKTFTVAKVVETSTTLIDVAGDYIEGNEVITSFYVDNEGSSDIIPSDNVSFDFRVYKMDGATEVTVYEATWTNVVIPANGTNLVYFKWQIPEDSAGTTLYCRGTINGANADREDNSSNNSSEKAVVVQNAITSQTPNTRYENTTPASYIGNISTPAPKNGKATWNMWEYADGEFVLKTYGIQISTNLPNVSPSSSCQTATFVDGKWTMKSGYGVEISYMPVISSCVGTSMPQGSAYTDIQSVSALFPEFQYRNTEGNYRTLQFSSGAYRFQENSDADGNQRVHFIPVYVKDGNYTVSVTVTQVWTPAGMITAVRNSNTITLNGNIYDDFYHGN